MARSTVHYADNETNNILKRLHNKLRPAGTPVQRVEFMIELLLLRIFEVKLKHDETFTPLRKLFDGENYRLLFSHLQSLTGEQALPVLNNELFPFYASILSKARAVFPNNLPQKVQDQLVLIEEVFSNSSFTANVKSGNLSEIIGLVHEIDEERLLQTDLLGDAIESSLSETGGTRDIGLYRTPDHIRQMMVALVDPDFTDTIFDPTCGTGGFLFDAYQYVLEKVTQGGKWVGEKAHPELQDYFKIHFKKFNAKMPSSAVANAFYRSGIGGIEYLGMIRKMAAINLYVRGLNPQNIEQGDSLRMYDPATDENSKSVIIANPPFGAERDQPAYPNVWEEFPRESETTILFVKLMFNLLKRGGRCAVVVSEGLLTWNQNSARALRKMLLDEAELRAVISLPQGVFVSKGGQGAKTSILYFEKGEPTEWVWYYKIENDGFTMGVNRKPGEGSQIPELIDLFTKFVERGQIPPETKHSFVIPARWIKTVDPRIKERIKTETKEELTEKYKVKREKTVAQLKEKRAKEKITEKEFSETLKQFEQIVENALQNETAKHIERAYTYSLNLQNYRSNLSKEQMKEWQETLNGVAAGNNETTSSLDKRYKDFQTAEPKTALKILASLDPRSALEMDIAREYVSAIASKDKKLEKLHDILKSGFQYPRVKLGELLIPKYEKIKKQDYKSDIDIVEKISFSDGKIHFREEKQTGMDLYKASLGDMVTSKINVHQGAVAPAPKELVCSTHYQVYQIKTSEIFPEYLVYAMRSQQMLELFSGERNKGIKNEQGADFLFDFSIPLPDIEIQREIVGKIEKQKSIIDGADKILEGWEPAVPESSTKKVLGDFIVDSLYGISSKLNREGKYPVLRMNNLDTLGNWYLEDLKYIDEEIPEERKLKKGDFIFNRTNSIDLVGKSGVIDFDFNGTWAGYLIRLRFNENLNPYCVRYLFAQKKYKNYFSSLAKPSGGQANINAEELAQTRIDYHPIETQTQIVERLDKEMQALENVRQLKEHAQKRIEEILKEVWGG